MGNLTEEIELMPTSGSVVSFNQSLPLFADRRSVSNTFTMSKYKSINENIVGAGKYTCLQSMELEMMM